MGSPGKLAFPAVCAKCGAPAGRRVRVEKVFSRSMRGDQPAGYVVLGTEVPFCTSCVTKHRSEATAAPYGQRVVSMFRSMLLVPALVFAGVAVWLLPRALDRLTGGTERSILVLAGLVAGFGVLGLLCARAAVRRTRRYRVSGPSTVTSAFDFTDDLSEMFERERHTYQLANRVFGDAFVAVNASLVWDGDHGRARDRNHSALLLLTITGCIAFIGWLGLNALR